MSPEFCLGMIDLARAIVRVGDDGMQPIPDIDLRMTGRLVLAGGDRDHVDVWLVKTLWEVWAIRHVMQDFSRGGVIGQQSGFHDCHDGALSSPNQTRAIVPCENLAGEEFFY